MTWSDLEWHGVAWSDLKIAWSGMEWPGVAWSGMEWHGVTLRLPGVAWSGLGCPEPLALACSVPCLSPQPVRVS